MAEVQEKEIWKNASRGVALVNVYDHNGKPTQKMVRSGKTIEVTERERIHLNTERAGTPGNDVFSSGIMAAEALPESTSDIEEIKANPNQLSDGDVKDILALHWQKFDAALGEITNNQVLSRIYDTAEADESTTVRQLDSIKARLLTVNPAHVFED